MPDGVLNLHGEFKSCQGGVLWSIARYWFVDRLQNVRAFDWRSLVYDNVMAQDRANWTIAHAVLYNLWPVHLESDALADPGYAERLIEYRLAARLPTVLAFERVGAEHLDLRSATAHRLGRARNITLPRLTPEEQQRIGLEL